MMKQIILDRKKESIEIDPCIFCQWCQNNKFLRKVINLFKMRFKEIEKSTYQQQAHTIEIERLMSRIDTIRRAQSKKLLLKQEKEKEKFLPKIERKNYSIDIIRRRQIEMENHRLVKKLAETSFNPSRYLSNVIGLETQKIVKKHRNLKQSSKRKLNYKISLEDRYLNTNDPVTPSRLQNDLTLRLCTSGRSTKEQEQIKVRKQSN